jgi:metallo-beta-lactamase family protein
VDVLVLSHAHIDHSGNIPGLVKAGFRGDIFATSATADLCGAMLLDSAHIQESDAQYANKQQRKRNRNEPPAEPLYTQEDAVEALRYFVAVGYARSRQIMPGVTLTFHDAGHMLGSAIVTLNIEDREANREVTLVFSGDLGQPGLPILRDPTFIDRADVLIMESTYGDRDHESFDEGLDTLERVVNQTYKRGGKVIIPSFAVGRTQEVVYALNQLMRARKIPRLPIFVDSPLAINVTEIFANHPEAYDAETRAFISGAGAAQNPFGFESLRYTRTKEQSMELNFLKEPAVIISASGMAEAGRILHHLKNNIEDPRNTVLIVGFQAEHTLGRRIEEKQPVVKIFGTPYDLRAQVERITGFSAHADRTNLLDWAGHIKKKPVRTFLVHGEEGPMNALAEGLRAEVGLERVDIPTRGQSFAV